MKLESHSAAHCEPDGLKFSYWRLSRFRWQAGQSFRNRPELAAHGAERLGGDKVAYLGTLRPDGSPSVHPVTPILGEQLFLFMEPTSPKGKDLQRDPRYTLHCAMEDSSGESGEFYVLGEAQFVQDAELRAQAAKAATYDPAERSILFVFSVEFAYMKTYADGKPDLRRSWASGKVETTK